MLSRTIAFISGVLCLQQLSSLPSWSWLAGLLLLVLIIFRLFPRAPVMVPAVACLGFVWAGGFGQLEIADNLDPSLEGQELLVEGVIGSLPEYQSGRVRFRFNPVQARLDGQKVAIPSRLLISWYNDYPLSLTPGQLWRLQLKLKRPWGMMNPGGFDYEGWLFTQGIHATGYVRNPKAGQLLSDSAWNAPIQRLRFSLLQRLQQRLADQPASGVIIALALGERGGISDEQWSVLLATGTNHLVAISGLHVGLVAGLMFFLARFLWCRCSHCCLLLPAPKAAALAALAGGFGYAALAGFSLPTQRAVLMLIVVLGAKLWQRPIAPLRALALALWTVLLWQPVAVLSAGFWLSFAAVALILFGMSGRLNPAGLWWRWGRVQVLASLGLMPILLSFFSKGSLSAPLANLVAVPLVGFIIVPLTLLGTLLLPVWEDAGGFLLELAAEIFQFGWPVLEWLTRHIPSIHSSAPAWTIGPALLGVVWMLMPKGWPFRGAGVALMLPILLLPAASPEKGTAQVTLLDVGQGLSAVVRTTNHALVFDTGARSRSGFNIGDAVLLPYLEAEGIARLDTLIISHGDNDHIGGARALLRKIDAVRVLTSVPRKMNWVAHERCHSAQKWHWDGVTFTILHPPNKVGEGRGNNDSCVLKVTAGGQSVLLPGDIELEAERQLLLSGVSLAAEVLIAPHHGSNTSSSEAFIDAVQPSWVLYPVGYHNRYGFPRPEILTRYRDREIRSLESYQAGAITFLLGKGPIVPSSYRQLALRYWHSR